MSYLPFLLEFLEQPRSNRLLDQQFGVGLSAEEMSAPLTLPRGDRAIFSLLQPTSGLYYRPWRPTAPQDTGSTILATKDQFQVNLDVQQFRPEEITVKTTGDNWVTIEAKHEEKEDEHGFIFRHFIRRYLIPQGHDMDRIESKLSSDGILTIIAPKNDDQQQNGARQIQITQTGQPSRPIENTKQENDEVQTNSIDTNAE